MRFRTREDRKIGDGGYSNVYLRINQTSKSALKVMDLDNDHIDAIIKEINTLRVLQHPNIVKLVGFEIFRSKIQIEMEYISSDLMKYMKKYENGLPLETSISYFRQITSAVNFLHNSGIIHLDVKPANILISETGDIKLCDFNCVSYHPFLKIKDFGTNICKPIENFISLSDKKLADEIRKFTGVHRQSYTCATDVYSLGIIFLFLVSGKILFYRDRKFEKIPPTRALRNFMHNPKLFITSLLSTSNITDKEKIIDFLLKIFTPLRRDRITLSSLMGDEIFGLLIPTKGFFITQKVIISDPVDNREWNNYLKLSLKILKNNRKVNYIVASTTLDIVIRLFIHNQISNIKYCSSEIQAAYNIACILFDPKFNYDDITSEDSIYNLIDKLDGFLFSDNPFMKVSNKEEIKVILTSLNNVSDYFNSDWPSKLKMSGKFNPNTKWSELISEN